MGYVLNPDGQKISLSTDKISVDLQVVIHSENGAVLGQIGLFEFPEDAKLERDDRGMFTAEGATPAAGSRVMTGYVERSNTDPIKQMTEMITYQRSLQSAASVMKMYDNLMTKATTDIGKL